MDVAAALAACTTQAQHYRVQLHAENILPPAAALALCAQADTLPEDAQGWVQRLARMALQVRPKAEPYRCHDLTENVTFYEGQGPAGAPRSLVVAFTGVAQRMMLPTAVFLQGFSAARCDVLMLRDPTRTAFLAGVPGYAAGLPELLVRIGDDIPLARYADRRCIGVSSGVAAALAFGPMFGAAVALGLGGMQPAAMHLRQAPRGIDRRLFHRLLLATLPTTTRLVVAHGEACQRDVLLGSLLALTIPGCRVLSVAEVHQHGVVPGLHHAHAWPRFLDEVLLGDTLPADGIWRPRPLPVSQPVADCPG
jgi:hypothetical protein